MNPDRRRAALAAAVSLAAGAAVGRLLLNSMNATDPRVLAILAENADPADAAGPSKGESASLRTALLAPDAAGPTAATPPPEAPDRLVIVVIDGLGEEPFGEAIRGTALAAFDWRATVDCGTPSLSRAVYHVLLTGAPQSVSGIRNNTHTGPARADDLAARVRDAGGTVGWALETVPWFHDLFGAPEDAYERLGDVPLWNPVTDRFDPPNPPGNDKSAKMARVLGERPRLALLHFIGVDHAGHHRGARSAEYRAAAREAVQAAAALRDEQARSPDGARTVWMIGADHGHLPQGGHGGPEPEVRRTTWIGLWPSAPAETGTLPRPRVEVPGVVPADRLATTFAAILEVPPPREALGEPLPLPDRLVAPSPRLAPRGEAVREAVLEADRDAHRGVLIRAAVVALGLLGLAAASLKRAPRGERALSLAGAALPVLGACLGFWALGPGLTLSAIGTHFAFMARSLLAMALGAALTAPLVRRWHVPATWVCLAAGAAPAAAYAITGGSMGASRLPDMLLLLLPATGLLPAGVLAGLAAVALAARALLAPRARDAGVTGKRRTRETPRG